MHRENVKFVDVRSLLYQKQQEQEEALRKAADSMDSAIETLALLCALGIILTFLVLLVCYQEGLL